MKNKFSKKTKILVITISLLLLIVLTSTTLGLFNYLKTGSNNNKVIAGDIYMKYTNESTKSINIIPSDTYNENDYFEFTISGKNTSNQNIIYDIVLNHGTNQSSPSIRLDDKFLKFRLVTVSNNVETELVKEASYPSIDNTVIYVGTIDGGTTVEVNTTYRLYVWVNGVIVGNVNQDYTSGEWSNVYANISVDVTGDFTEKTVYTPPVTLNELKAKVSTDGLIAINTDGGLYNGTGTIREYRYSGVDSRWSDAEGTVKNYITFNNEMWRIVGIFKGDTNDGANAWNIKIVRDYPIGSYDGVADSIQIPASYASTGAGTKTLAYDTYSISESGSYPAFVAQKMYWNSGGTNGGSAYPSKSGILLWLNEASNANSWYYKNYDSTTGINTAYKDYIAITTFYTRAGNSGTTVANEYNLERTTGTTYNSEATYEGKIGMLYASDYAYASASTIWNGTSTTMSNYSDTGGLSSNKLNNWMLKPNDSSGYYWFISPSSNGSNRALRWHYSGSVSNENYVANFSYGGLRPVLNLKSDTVLTGSGTYANPYTIVMDSG